MSSLNEDFQAPPPPPLPETESRAPRPTKLRVVAIGLFVVGLIVAVLGIPKLHLLTGGLSTGILLAFIGVVLGALSFIPLPAIPEAEPPLSFFAKVTGIFYGPSRVFRNLRAHPHWFGAFAVVAVLSVVYTFAFVQRITPERIVDHITERLSELGRFAPPPDQMERVKEAQLSQYKNPAERVQGAVKAVGFLFLVAAATAGLCLLGVLIFGGSINYWQSLAVVFYYWLPIVAIQKLLGLLILYLKAPEDLHPILNQETTLQDNLSLLFSSAEHPVLYVLMSFIGLTWLYLLWLRAKGLRNGGTKVSNSAAWSVSIMLYVLLMIAVTIWTSLFSGFIS
jgi:hypothetical protein